METSLKKRWGTCNISQTASTRGVPQPFARNVLVGIEITHSLSEDNERKIGQLALWVSSVILDMSVLHNALFQDQANPKTTSVPYQTRHPIITDPDDVVLFTKAATALHNYLRSEDAVTYCPTGFVDEEDGGGNVIIGGRGGRKNHLLECNLLALLVVIGVKLDLVFLSFSLFLLCYMYPDKQNHQLKCCASQISEKLHNAVQSPR